ncbi:hypothetical protein QFC21_003155 [Naganishia friedmannii]|uniref:Uncharacterized protein n=1 Tax=Naganishia friedmannii TaxID=89922 RepID=A0ACC2VT44_9TREE|nr:hypothetical protein QFC21_003155 [Naganishia friedmannii]
MDANQQNIYINTPVVPAESQQGQGQEQTQASPQPAFANAAETQGGGLQELLEALRHALKDDSQTSAFKQFSHVQEYSRRHEIPRPVSQPVPHVMPGVIRRE